jgi:hypothetical protein
MAPYNGDSIQLATLILMDIADVFSDQAHNLPLEEQHRVSVPLLANLETS